MYDTSIAAYYAEPPLPDVWSPHDGGAMRLKQPDCLVHPDHVAATIDLLRATYRHAVLHGTGNPWLGTERIFEQLDRDLGQHDSATLLTLAEACLMLVHHRGDEPGEHAEAMLTLVEDPMAACRAALEEG